MSDALDPNVKIFDAQLRAVVHLKRELENPRALMKQLGALVLGASVDSFRDQKFGDYEWPARYPGQSEPKLNIAGAVSDFAGGRLSPKPIRFIDRPVLVDEGFRGGLVGSITYRALDENSFEVGTVKPYAATHQYGRPSEQPITPQVRQGIRRWLYKGGKKDKGYKKKSQPYAAKLEPILKKRRLRTIVGKRPFIGIFPRLWNDILSAIQDHFTRHAGGA